MNTKRELQRLKLLKARIDTNFMEIGRILITLHDSSIWGESQEFWQTIETETTIAKRKGQTILQIARVVGHLDIPDHDVIKVGWSKVARMASWLTKDNWQENFKLARSITYNEVVEHFRTRPRRVDVDSSTLRRTLTFTREEAERFDELVVCLCDRYKTTSREEALLRHLVCGQTEEMVA